MTGATTARRLRAAPAYAPAVLIAIAGWLHRWMNEDAYINLRVVEQIFAGHGPVFNAGERVEAATSPLWILVLVIGRGTFGLFVRDEWIAVVAALLAAVAAFVVAGKAAHVLHRGEDGVVVPVGLALVAGVAVVWDFSTSGLEMGLVWLWLATAWLALVWAARAPEVTGRLRTGACVVLGLAPLIRPEITLMMLALLVAWFALVRPRRVVHDLALIFAVPVAYELFRMGYYASLVPNTALAKDAGGLHLRQGWNYAWDLIEPYKLWLSALLAIAVVVVRRLRDRRVLVATVAMLVAGGLDAAYIVAVGGDYMHGRLLLPALFAFALPISMTVQRARVMESVVAGAAVAWATVSVIAFRPPPPPPGYFVAQIADWRAVSGAKIVLDEAEGQGWTGRAASVAYAQGQRGYYRALSITTIPPKDPDAFVLTLGSIGVPAYNAGRRIWVVDIGGLAEPLAARTTIVPGRPAGHRKQVDPAWYDARFAAPDANDPPAVLAARHALECGAVRDLMTAVDGDLTPGRFLSNMFHSFEFTRLEIPMDPVEAEKKFC